MHPTELALLQGPTGQLLTFRQEPLEMVNVYRRVIGLGSAWQLVALNASSPLLDAEPYSPGTELEYHVQHFTQQDVYQGHSPIVRITLS